MSFLIKPQVNFHNRVQENTDSFRDIGRTYQAPVYTDTMSNKMLGLGANMLQSYVMNQIEEFSRKQQQRLLEHYDDTQ